MTIDIMDNFFADKKEFVEILKNISQNYSLEDFVKVSEKIRDYLTHNEETKIGTIHGCIYNIRKGYLKLGIESVEKRLTREYFDYLLEVLESKQEDKVFYIVAYHYLALIIHMGYKLTVAQRAPFPFVGTEMGSVAKKEYAELWDKMQGRVDGIVKYFSEADLIYYNKIYRELGWLNPGVKYYSLLENLMGFPEVLPRCEFDFEFRKLLDVFVFRYRAIFTEEKIPPYRYSEVEEKIISGLVDV